MKRDSATKRCDDVKQSPTPDKERAALMSQSLAYLDYQQRGADADSRCAGPNTRVTFDDDGDSDDESYAPPVNDEPVVHKLPDTSVSSEVTTKSNLHDSVADEDDDDAEHIHKHTKRTKVDLNKEFIEELREKMLSDTSTKPGATPTLLELIDKAALVKKIDGDLKPVSKLDRQTRSGGNTALLKPGNRDSVDGHASSAADVHSATVATTVVSADDGDIASPTTQRFFMNAQSEPVQRALTAFRRTQSDQVVRDTWARNRQPVARSFKHAIKKAAHEQRLARQNHMLSGDSTTLAFKSKS